MEIKQDKLSGMKRQIIKRKQAVNSKNWLDVVKSAIKIRYIILLLLFLVIPSFRAIFKYSPYQIATLICYVAICTIFYYLFSKSEKHQKIFIEKILGFKWLAYMLILLFAITMWMIYPIADARKNIGAGSTADDAIIEASLTLLQDARLYSATTYDGAPISPGPGWILLNSPFVLFGIYWLFPTFHILAAVIATQFLSGSYREINLALLILPTSLIFWELLVTGHDLIPLGFSFVTVIVLTYYLRNSSSVITISLLAATAILTGIIATSRIVFIFIPPLLALFIWKSSKKNAVFYLLTSMLVSSTLHLYFYTTSDFYQPLHLLSRGQTNVGANLSFIGLAATVIAAYAAYQHQQNTIESWMVSFFICISIPLTAIAFGELSTIGFQFASWEGANYLAVPAPLLVFITAKKFLTNSNDRLWTVI
jgi:hypothetical protein